MELAFAAVTATLVFLLVMSFSKLRGLKRALAARDAELSQVKAEAAQSQAASEAAVQEVHKLVNQQLAAISKEAERMRLHYEAEAKGSVLAADAAVAKAVQELESLRRYQGLADAESEANRILAEAVAEATSLRSEAAALLALSRTNVVRES